MSSDGYHCADGCGSWTSGRRFTYRGVDSRFCERCAEARERDELVRSLEVPVRDANAVGLGDRRGLAIEELPFAVRADGNYPPRFIVYVDGRELFRRASWEEAYRQGAGYVKGEAYRNGEPKPKERTFAITFTVRGMDGELAKKTVHATGETPPIATGRARRSLEELGIDIASPIVSWDLADGAGS